MIAQGYTTIFQKTQDLSEVPPVEEVCDEQILLTFDINLQVAGRKSIPNIHIFNFCKSNGFLQHYPAVKSIVKKS